MQATGIPDPEALTGGTLQAYHERSIARSSIAVAAGDFAGNARPDGAVVVANPVAVLAARTGLDARQHVADHLLGQFATVEGFVARLQAALRLVRGNAGFVQQGLQVQPLLPVGFTRQHTQQIGATDEVVETSYTEHRHQFAHLAGDPVEEFHHSLHLTAKMPAAQYRVLCCHACCAVVQVADTQVLAAHDDKRCGAETEALRTQQCRLDDIQSSLDTTIHLQPDTFTQVVGAQDLVCLAQPQFPRTAGILHRRQRAGAGAAVIAGNGDLVGVGLGDTGGDGTNPGLRDQLDGNQGRGIHLLEVEDQLRQVLDGINVVVRRRGDQRRAFPGMTQAGYQGVDLAAGKLPALARLRALRDLDLQHVGIDQVVRCDAKAA